MNELLLVILVELNPWPLVILFELNAFLVVMVVELNPWPLVILVKRLLMLVFQARTCD